jgi:hypothetical protein
VVHQNVLGQEWRTDYLFHMKEQSGCYGITLSLRRLTRVPSTVSHPESRRLAQLLAAVTPLAIGSCRKTPRAARGAVGRREALRDAMKKGQSLAMQGGPATDLSRR